MTVLFLSIFLPIRRKISSMQTFLSSLGCDSVYKHQEELPYTKIIAICASAEGLDGSAWAGIQ
jgi:hypothetical protein